MIFHNTPLLLVYLSLNRHLSGWLFLLGDTMTLKYTDIFNAYVETADEFLKRRGDHNLSVTERDEMIIHAFGKLDKEKHNVQAYKYFIAKYFSEDDSIHTKLTTLSRLMSWMESNHAEITNENIDHYYSTFLDNQ